MQNTRCPKCGHETALDNSCPTCGRDSGRARPKPPAELAGRVFAPTPPEMAEEIRRTFDEATFFAEVEEALQSGGADIDALLARVERKAHGGN